MSSSRPYWEHIKPKEKNNEEEEEEKKPIADKKNEENAEKERSNARKEGKCKEVVRPYLIVLTKGKFVATVPNLIKKRMTCKGKNVVDK